MSQDFIPDHLKKYVITQDYDRYTAEDQAAWRYIMRQLKHFLSQNAHECYLDGLAKTGINVDSIPSIEQMDQHLRKFGWRAIPVSGFIPPMAFMEFQSLGILPIASDMRSVEHILYTPAPDIVHEAAGHAPILVNPHFSSYLRSYAKVARHAILSSEDLALYEAIRDLSDIKEHRDSTKSQIREAEERLQQVTRSLSFVSEAALLGRMNWWTAEYGLIGPLNSPQIFGAGLLSSIGESRECLGPKTKRLALSIDCIDYSYDITEPQPQLFVTPDFKTLEKVLEDLADQMSFKVGGNLGLSKALESKTVNTIELNSSLQISGKLGQVLWKNDSPAYLQFSGSCQLSTHKKQLSGHGVDFHSQGYGTPVGRIDGSDKCLSLMSREELTVLGLVIGKHSELRFSSGITVTGTVRNLVLDNGKLLLISWDNCKVLDVDGQQLLFDPSWGSFDMAVGSKVASVFGGPADWTAFGDTDRFIAARVPQRNLNEAQKKLHAFFKLIRDFRESKSNSNATLESLLKSYRSDYSESWLIGIEVLELCYHMEFPAKVVDELKAFLLKSTDKQPLRRQCVEWGIELAPVEI